MSNTSRSDEYNPNTSGAAPPGSHTGNRRQVDHIYRDFSRYLQEGGDIIKHKKSGANFPAKLHLMLSEPQFSHIIVWMPHGRAWKILNKELLMTNAVPAYFVLKKYRSFIRQLSCWGFKRLRQSGADCGCYYHEAFLRGIPELTELLRRVPANQGKSTPGDEEPNFYLISSSRPLPPPPMTIALDHEDPSTLGTEGLAEATVALMPASQSVTHHISADDWSNAQNTIVPAAEAGSATSLSAAVATMSPCISLPRVHSYEMSSWSNAQFSMTPSARDSSASSVAATMTSSKSMHCIPSYETTHKLMIPSTQKNSISSSANATLPPKQKNHSTSHQMSNTTYVQNIRTYRTAQDPTMPSGRESSTSHSGSASAASAQMYYPSFYQMENTTNVQNSRIASAQSSLASTRFSAALAEASTFMNYEEPPYQTTNDAKSNSSSRGSPASSNQDIDTNENNSAYSSYPSSSYVTASTAPHPNDPHYYYYGGGHNYYSTQGQVQPSYHQQESTTSRSSVRQQEHYFDNVQECYEGEESFKDDMNRFLDDF
mmetsp:Transcript_27005/g.48725  ORF Transcript_27005/g.48725 Transcript_27005/m.48725 type:complete len:542 (-) Transcript_27005:23-1648(-)